MLCLASLLGLSALANGDSVIEHRFLNPEKKFPGIPVNAEVQSFAIREGELGTRIHLFSCEGRLVSSVALKTRESSLPGQSFEVIPNWIGHPYLGSVMVGVPTTGFRLSPQAGGTTVMQELEGEFGFWADLAPVRAPLPKIEEAPVSASLDLSSFAPQLTSPMIGRIRALLERNHEGFFTTGEYQIGDFDFEGHNFNAFRVESHKNLPAPAGRTFRELWVFEFYDYKSPHEDRPLLRFFAYAPERQPSFSVAQSLTKFTVIGMQWDRWGGGLDITKATAYNASFEIYLDYFGTERPTIEGVAAGMPFKSGTLRFGTHSLLLSKSFKLEPANVWLLHKTFRVRGQNLETMILRKSHGVFGSSYWTFQFFPQSRNEIMAYFAKHAELPPPGVEVAGRVNKLEDGLFEVDIADPLQSPLKSLKMSFPERQGALLVIDDHEIPLSHLD